MKKRFAFVGLSWWGLGPADMAASMTSSGYPSDFANIWNISSRLDRILMDSSLAPLFVQRRLKRFERHRQERYSAIFVVSPHRLALKALAYLKQHCDYLVAVLGDDPVGVRAVSDECWTQFDIVLAADERWLSRLESFGGDRKVMPWGSTLVDANLLTAESYRPEALLLVGAPYPERVTVARRLAALGNPLTVQGDDWPSIAGARRRASDSRLTTLAAIREHRELVVNIHHRQFVDGLNPQFFDYAAAGIPQIVVHAESLATYQFGLVDSPGVRTIGEPLLNSEPVNQACSEVIARVRSDHMFHSCIERALNDF